MELGVGLVKKMWDLWFISPSFGWAAPQFLFWPFLRDSALVVVQVRQEALGRHGQGWRSPTASCQLGPAGPQSPRTGTKPPPKPASPGDDILSPNHRRGWRAGASWNISPAEECPGSPGGQQPPDRLPQPRSTGSGHTRRPARPPCPAVMLSCVVRTWLKPETNKSKQQRWKFCRSQPPLVLPIHPELSREARSAGGWRQLGPRCLAALSCETWVGLNNPACVWVLLQGPTHFTRVPIAAASYC